MKMNTIITKNDNDFQVIKENKSSDDDQKQKIILQGNDNSNTYPIYSTETDIYLSKNSSQSRINASNKIKVNKIVNFEWEQRYTYGNMIAVHKSGQYFAYSIRVDNSGKVKVFNKKLNEKVLLRSFRGRVVDLSFAYYDAEVLLGCVDESGCLQIFKITLDSHSKMQTTVVFNLAPLVPNPSVKSLPDSDLSSINRSLNQTSKQGVSSPSGQGGGGGGSVINRIIWCNYIPDSIVTAECSNSKTLSGNEDQQQTAIAEEASKVFVVTRKNRADIFHLDLIQQTYDCTRQLDTEEIVAGHLVIDEHKATILTASFSPDGSAIASSSADGEVNFFKISFNNSNGNSNNRDDDDDDEDAKSNKMGKESWDLNKNDDDNDDLTINKPRRSSTATSAIQSPPSPKCLQKWKPHDNKPVTSLYFLDDVKNPSPDAQVWSFILTGADYNREIKLWCCIKWECLQTINFLTQVNDESSLSSTQPNLPAPLFKTAIDLTSTYLVMSDITRKCFFVLHLFQDTEKKQASCTAISEYILAYPALSFAIIDSYRVKARKYNQLNTTQSQLPNSLTQEDLNSSESNSLDLISDVNNTSSAGDLCTMIRLYCIQTKQLQEMQIFLSGEQSINAYNNSSASLSPPPIQSILLGSNSPFTKSGNLISNSTLTSNNQSLTMSLSSQDNQSILHKLLPNASSPIKFGLNNKKFMSLSIPPKIKGSTSFNSEPNENSDHNKSLNSSSSNTVNSNNIQDSAIIQIVTPNLQLTSSSSTVLANPVLLTPDAFINSPTNSNRSNSRTANNVDTQQQQQQQQQSIKNDILQSLLINSVSSSTSTQSNNNTTSNLISSRTSSLTHVTAPLNNNLTGNNSTSVNNINSNNNSSNLNGTSVVVPIPVSGTASSASSAQQLNLLSNSNNKIKQRTHSSSSSSSAGSSSSSSSSSSSIHSYVNNMDLADKEVASLSAKNKLSIGILNKSNPKTECLLNKVVIDNDNDDDSFMAHQNESTSRNHNDDLVQQQPQPLSSTSSFQLNSKSFNLELNQNWQSTDADHISMSNAKSMPNAATLEEYELKNLLVQMTKTLKLQNEEIESLKRSQINSQHMLKSHIDSTLKQFLNQQQQNQQRNSQSSIATNDLQQTLVMHNLQSVVEKIIKEEINKLIQSQFAQHILDPLREQISRELADKLKSIEHVFKDSVLKLFKSKSTMDTLSQSIVGSMQSSIVNSYRETFQKVIVPNFEKSCQNMYQQVNSSFAKGTQDYLIEFDQLAKQHRKMFEENKEPILVQMKQFSDQMQLHSTQVGNTIAANLQQQIESNLRNTNAILQDTIISSVKAIIKEELHLAMRDQQQTLPDRLISQMRQSGTMTPVCHTPIGGEQNNAIFNSQQQQQDTQMQITQHLKKGAINSAFQVALCAADLNLLENLCELVSPSQAFDPKSKLQQPVILSLIQQLSQDLNSNTELKIKYLEEAMVNLDLTVPLTIEHTPIVMNQLVLKLQQHIQMHPNDKTTRQCKMLLLASKSLNTQKQPQFGASVGLLSNSNQQNKSSMLSFNQ